MKLVIAIFISSLVSTTGARIPDDPRPKKTVRLFTSHFENVLGTSLELKTYSVSENDANAADFAAIREIGRMERILSAYDSTSEFSHWFKTSNRPARVSPKLFEVLGLFDQWRVSTGGALDASAEVITRLWKGAAARNRIPSPEELKRAVAEVQRPHWILDSPSRTATHLDNAALMLNSFVKSYGLK